MRNSAGWGGFRYGKEQRLSRKKNCVTLIFVEVGEGLAMGREERPSRTVGIAGHGQVRQVHMWTAVSYT